MVSELKDKMDDKVDNKEKDQKEEDQKEEDQKEENQKEERTIKRRTQAHPSAQMSDFAL